MPAFVRLLRAPELILRHAFIPLDNTRLAHLCGALDSHLRGADAGEVFDGKADVHVADGLGELGLWFRLARIAFVGGSLVEGPGGHNPLEPARLGAPIVTGPLVRNWRSVFADLGESVVRIADAAGLQTRTGHDHRTLLVGDDLLEGFGQRAPPARGLGIEDHQPDMDHAARAWHGTGRVRPGLGADGALVLAASAGFHR